MTEQRDTPEIERRYLLDHPQRLGILPTNWFWNDPENWRLVRWGLAAFFFAAMMIGFFTFSNSWLGWLIPFAAYVLAVGLLERYIRREAPKRRALRLGEDGSSLPPTSEAIQDRNPT